MGKKIFGMKAGTLAIWLVIGVLVYLGWTGGFFSGLFAAAPGTTVTSEVTVISDETPDLLVRARNPANSSLEYTAATVTYLMDGKKVGTLSLNSDGTYKAGSDALVRGETYEIRVVNSDTHASIAPYRFVADQAKVYVDLEIPETGTVEFAVYDTTYNNLTSGYVSDASTNSATTIGSGGTGTWIIRARVDDAVSAADFGSRDPARPVYICADFNLAKYQKSDVVLSSSDVAVSEVSVLPTYCGNNGYDKAWKLGSNIRGDRAYYEFVLQAKASLGDPGATDDIKLVIVDSADVQKTDGSIVVDTVDSSGSDAGETNKYIQLEVA